MCKRSRIEKKKRDKNVGQGKKRLKKTLDKGG